MEVIKSDLIIIGSGPAGLSAAVSARENGAGEVAIIERLEAPGGMLRQCFHRGFGRAEFGRELTGPEYAQRDIQRAQELMILHHLRSRDVFKETLREIDGISKKDVAAIAREIFDSMMMVSLTVLGNVDREKVERVWRE